MGLRLTIIIGTMFLSSCMSTRTETFQGEIIELEHGEVLVSK